MKKQHLLLSGILFFILFQCTPSQEVPRVEETTTRVPSADREFRAAWVATVANINWPSEPGIPVEQQKKEALALLDLLKDHHFNAVIFQVRPQCDALYPSPLEPWSYYLTGEQGKAPEPFYDPLEFWINAAHERGLELHAWLNPYRAHHIVGGEISEQSIVNKMPNQAKRLANGYWWLDPAQKETQDHSYAVVMDIVERYDVDGIHFDDYFYPYPSYNEGADFPDGPSWEKYQKKGGKLSRSDWRRDAVNTFIQRVYKGIKKEKKHVKFGLSPFGIWRPQNPSSIEGFDQYDQLYADAKLWLNEAWIDYYAPQLYWPINQVPQSFPVLLGWWERQNTQDRHLWPGISIGRMKGDSAKDETVNQIMITRGMLPERPGIIHWSIGPLVRSPELAQALLDGPYARQALVPSSSWLGSDQPRAVDLQYVAKGLELEINWNSPEEDEVRQWVLYYKYASRWRYKIFPPGMQKTSLDGYQLHPTLEKDPEQLANVEEPIWNLDSIAISAVNRLGNESELELLSIQAFPMEKAPAIEDLMPEQQ